jgi:hypothetical protein
MFCEELAAPLPSVLKNVKIKWFHLANTFASYGVETGSPTG